MKNESAPLSPSGNVENELDVRSLCCALWRGKLWIIATALLFALVVFVWSLLVKQEWSATAITDKPTVNQLGHFYAQQQFLRNLDARNAPALAATPEPSAMEEAWQEFVMQLSSWDTRREFWQQTDYFKARRSGNARNDAALLDDMINNIQYTPADTARNLSDNVRLTAETAADANNLLRQYVAFASERAARHLNDELQGAWRARTAQLQAQVERQEAVAKAIYDRQINSVQEALKIAQQQGIEQARTATPTEQLPESEMFQLGRPLLQARLENLRASGPDYGLDYYQNRAMLSTLRHGPTLDEKFQSYRYLRTPEEPVKRDSPRRAFLMVLWGAMGALVGAGVALLRRSRG
ncbi:ECA polysaccharide chain length modulation protein [Pantoea sp. 1.19]|uniref:ECA polysaccharide chain length modulation protein n=1 Tax=Pantoea sp. 1.19 TaxID=1925589 RepID=UPI0009490ACA|nr:ECA polysaccharide chain length modulation protein [Pantoea sp. 1.19]